MTLALKEFLDKKKRHPIISITGPAWVGKSTISTQISEKLQWVLLTELPEQNPFLKLIKNQNIDPNNPELWWNNQNYFLATDIAQIVKWFDFSSYKPVIFDFSLVQPYIFSQIKLWWTPWFTSFEQMYKLQFNSIPKPDIIIEVSAETKTILERLEKRWKYIDSHLEQVIETLNKNFQKGSVKEHYKWISYINFQNNWDNLEELQKRIEKELLNQI